MRAKLEIRFDTVGVMHPVLTDSVVEYCGGRDNAIDMFNQIAGKIRDSGILHSMYKGLKYYVNTGVTILALKEITYTS